MIPQMIKYADSDSMLIAVILWGITFGSLFLLASSPVHAQTKNGFDLSNASIPAEEIQSGGPPRDGIPALDQPAFKNVEEVNWLDGKDRILGITRNGVSKAYPIRILNWHEIVNDQFKDEHILVTYCPLCRSGMAFISTVDGKTLDFGVSGLLYNSDVLMYDRQTESLWSQLMAKAVSGPMQGIRLDQIAISHTTWQDWQSNHPETKVLSRNTGYDRNYNRDPYSGYDKNNQVYFPVSNEDDTYHRKALVMGVVQDDFKKAYPFPELKEHKVSFKDQLNDQMVTVYYDAKNNTGKIITEEGEEVPTVITYWFAWSAFYPDSKIFKAE